jgi:hypothetical protein
VATAVVFTHIRERGALPCSVKVVVAPTLTTVCMLLQPMTVNVPDVPATPHPPAVVDPFTEITIPEAVNGGIVGGDQTLTIVASRASVETVPCGPRFRSERGAEGERMGASRDVRGHVISTEKPAVVSAWRILAA